MSRAWHTLDGIAPRIIAHRGASGVCAEHTRMAYDLAVAQGSDVIEPDLVLSRDSKLIVRHDRGLRRSTDVAAHAAFSMRERDGDWKIDEFLRDELRVLHALQPMPGRSDIGGPHSILDFSELLDWAGTIVAQTGRDCVLYPELKHVAEFSARGLDPVGTLLRALASPHPRGVRIWLQSFDVDALQQLHDSLALPTYLLLDVEHDWRTALRRHGGWLTGLGVNKALLHDASGADSGLVASVHASGLQVHAWTYRDDSLAPRAESIHDELDAAFDLGVDALFCDFPATALAWRAQRALD